MKKIPCLFQRVFNGHRAAEITRKVTPGCEWVLAGEGTASRKWDGTACAVIGGVLHKRYDAKRGKPAPENGVPCQDPDPVTGHWPHWVPVDRSNPADKHHLAAWATHGPLPDGTYELIGPQINGNPEGVGELWFHAHGDCVLEPERTFDGLRWFLEVRLIEGIVFAHSDGRMCKIRRDDFGLPWGSKARAR
jgi:hypothetical protein